MFLEKDLNVSPLWLYTSGRLRRLDTEGETWPDSEQVIGDLWAYSVSQEVRRQMTKDWANTKADGAMEFHRKNTLNDSALEIQGE